jgi:CheY-like chemotaxis protein
VPGARTACRGTHVPPGPLRVLVVDDTADTVDSFLLLLQLWGYVGVAAYDGPGALDTARRERPDVVLLDLGLPRMDGYAVARQLRQLPGLEGVLLVAITGHGQPETRRLCQEAGFDALLLKPFDLEEVQKLLAASVK